MADVAQIGFQADTSGLVDAKKKLEAIPPAATKAERAADRLSKLLGGALTGDANKLKEALMGGIAANDNFAGSMGKSVRAVSAFKLAISGLSGVIAGVVSALSIGAYVQLADTWSDLSARVGLASGDMENSAAVMQRLSDMARRTYSSLQNTAEGFIGTADSLRELGLNTTQTLDYVEALNNALVISGAKGEKAESAMNALNKAMAIGKLQGDGLETVMANAGRVSAALAKELGITQNQLRKFASQGKITSGVIYNALTKQLETLREEADSMPATVGDAFVIVGNGVLQLVGAFDKFTGLSSYIASSIISIGDALKFVADNIPLIMQYAAKGAVALGLMFAPAIVGGAYALVTAISELALVLVGKLVGALASATAAMIAFALANPFTAFVYGVGIALAALYVFRDAIANVLGKDFVASAKDAINKVIGFFVGAYNAIIAQWEKLPTVFSGLGKQAYNSFISEFEKPALTINGFEVIPGLNLSGMKAQLTEAEKAAMNFTQETIQIAQGVDYIGALDNAIGGMTDKLTVATEKAGKLNEQLDPDKKKKKRGKTEAERYEDIIKGAERSIAAMQAEANAVGLSALETAKLKYETQLLNEAQQKNIKLSEAQRNQLIAIAHGMAELEVSTAKAKEQLEFSKDITKGFFSDLRSGIAEGKSLWESFGDAALNVLNKIVDKLLDDVINALFEVNKAGTSGGGGGGLLGGLFSWIGGLFSAKGNVFGSSGVQAFAQGASFANSVVDKPTAFAFGRGGANLGIMGEAGPEAVMPLTRGPDGNLGVQMYNGNGGNSGSSVVYAPSYTIEAGATQESVSELRKIVDNDRKEFTNKVVKTVQATNKRSNGALG